MIQINNNFADYYYMFQDGKIYNSKIDRIQKIYKNHRYVLYTKDNRRKTISLKRLYKMVYNKPFCIDRTIDLDNQVWKVIDDTEQCYYISNKGRVKSMHGYNAAILKPYNNQSGYSRIDIIEGGRRSTKLVHRLVAAAFLPFPQKIDMQLHHKDFDKNNNSADNLEWLTTSAHYRIHKLNNSKGDKQK